MHFGFEEGMLYAVRDIDNECRYEGAEKQTISKVTIYDVKQEPVQVTDLSSSGAG